jgi:diguanylate cyclase (GGDEF)-like protein
MMKAVQALRALASPSQRSGRALPLSPERTGLALLTLLAACELFVAVQYSPWLGGVLVFASALLSLVAIRLQRDAAARAAADAENRVRSASEGFLLDKETSLPNRQHLIDQLAREIARAQRYSHQMTITLIQVSRLRDLQTAWGGETGRNAVMHVAETLRRVTRTSDFLARIDDDHFAVILMQCSAEQASAFGDRVALAVSNRPLRSTSNVRVPLYINVDVKCLQYDMAKFRGPLDFLSAAGGDLVAAPEGRSRSGQPRSAAADPKSLRRQLVQDYYPEGEMEDFASAYRAQRGRRAV